MPCTECLYFPIPSEPVILDYLPPDCRLSLGCGNQRERASIKKKFFHMKN